MRVGRVHGDPGEADGTKQIEPAAQEHQRPLRTATVEIDVEPND